MFEFITNTEERGQVGIGTLIVFIAMVLVAAIAAGVLINTAGFLQTQAEATGEDSTDLVSERINVNSEVGIVSGDTLSEIRLSVAGAPGAGQIDLSETTIQAVGPGGQENLVFTDGAGTTSTETVATDALTSNDDGEVIIDTVNAAEFVDEYDEIDSETDDVDVTLSIEGETATKTASVDSLQDTTFVIESDGDLSSGATGTDDSSDAGLGDGDEVTLEIEPSSGGDVFVDETETAADSSAPAIEAFTTSEQVSELGPNEFAVGSDGDFYDSAVLDEEKDFTILINPDSGAFDDSGAFGEGQQATLDIVSPAGATTQVELRAPDLFNEDGEAVRL
nr:archaellin/type IV pilin N-terminal domain-containing protein [Halorubrum rubrum]